MENDKTVIRAWLLTSGVILCVDQNFIDYAGWEGKDLLGKNFCEVASDKELLKGMIEKVGGISGSMKNYKRLNFI